jgi:hypothetical protein
MPQIKITGVEHMIELPNNSANNFIGVFAVTAILLWAGAQSLPTNDPWATNAHSAVPADGQWNTNAQTDNQTARKCPPGYDWGPAGYLGGGTWRPAFCGSRSNTIDF